MFLVEMSFNTIREEIKDLDMKKDRKAYALKDSSSQLKKDEAKLVQFIESDNMTTNNRIKDSDVATQERKTAEARIKRYDTEI
tara:strand:+ start:66 stop:314 length:249 start_codon:yes stop_codon:yes gene_type:complete